MNDPKITHFDPLQIKFLFLHSYDATLIVKSKQIVCGHPIFFSKLAARELDVLAGVHLDFFVLQTSGTQNIAKKRKCTVYVVYVKCTLCLGLVGVRYPSELELPVITGRSR